MRACAGFSAKHGPHQVAHNVGTAGRPPSQAPSVCMPAPVSTWTSSGSALSPLARVQPRYGSSAATAAGAPASVANATITLRLVGRAMCAPCERSSGPCYESRTKLASGYAAQPAPGLSWNANRPIRRQLRSRARGSRARGGDGAEAPQPRPRLVAGVDAAAAEAEVESVFAAHGVSEEAGARRQDGRD